MEADPQDPADSSSAMQRRLIDQTIQKLFESPSETELNVDPQLLETTVKNLIDSPPNSENCNLDGQDLMAVDALMRIIDGVYTPKQVTIVINTT